MKTAYLIIDLTNGNWVGIHRNMPAAKYHMNNRQAYFPKHRFEIRAINFQFI